MIASMMVSNGTLATFNWLRCVNEALVTEMCRRDEAPQPIIWLIFGDIRLVYEFSGKTVLCAFDRVVKVADCYQSAEKCSHPLWVPRESSNLSGRDSFFFHFF